VADDSDLQALLASLLEYTLYLASLYIQYNNARGRAHSLCTTTTTTTTVSRGGSDDERRSKQKQFKTREETKTEKKSKQASERGFFFRFDPPSQRTVL